MKFGEVIGQEQAKERLLQMVNQNRLPHSLLLSGPQGCGKMALALALASYLLGEREDPQQTDANVSAMLAKWQHPDLHFTYPVIRPVGTTPDHKMISDDFAPQWYAMLSKGPYFNINTWLEAMNAANQQAMIFAGESDNLQKKLSFKASLANYKVSIIWLPERMNTECANKLLKLLEEPPAKTIFIMVSEQPERLLETIRSRTQIIHIKKISNTAIEQALISKRSIDANTAQRVARIANGNWLTATNMLSAESEDKKFFSSFTTLMRLAYMRNMKELKKWSEDTASYGREEQKRMLLYFHRMIRENFMYNFKQQSLIHFTKEEENFAKKFSPYINEANIVEFYELIEITIRDISQNANPKIVFFDFTIKVAMLLMRKVE